MLVDKAYDVEWIRAMIEALNEVRLIPDLRTIKTPHAFRCDLCRLRNRIEFFYNKLKQFQRIATHY